MARSNREIASQLNIEERTVKAHIGRLMRKTGAGNRVELSMQALKGSLGPIAKTDPVAWVAPFNQLGHAESAASEFTNYQILVSRTVDAFGDELKASRWLSLPNRDLDGQTPLQAVQNSGYDLRVLEPILTRMEHGVDY
jgi:hypothetical protein